MLQSKNYAYQTEIEKISKNKQGLFKERISSKVWRLLETLITEQQNLNLRWNSDWDLMEFNSWRNSVNCGVILPGWNSIWG